MGQMGGGGDEGKGGRVSETVGDRETDLDEDHAKPQRNPAPGHHTSD